MELKLLTDIEIQKIQESLSQADPRKCEDSERSHPCGKAVAKESQRETLRQVYINLALIYKNGLLSNSQRLEYVGNYIEQLRQEAERK